MEKMTRLVASSNLAVDPPLVAQQIIKHFPSLLMDFLSGQASSSLLAELWEQYGKAVDPQGSLEKMLESLQEDETEAEADIPLP